jgi:hypothetical protein
MYKMTDGSFRTNGHGGGPVAPNHEDTGGFISALQDAARENPVSAALIGMGVLWLFMGGSNTSLFGGGRKSILHKAASYPEHAVGDVGSTFRQVADNTADAASQIGGAVRQASTAVGDVASRTGAKAADAVSSAYKMASDIASESTGVVANATSTAARAVQEKGASLGTVVQQNLSDLLNRQPLLLGALGVAVGAGIAASIRTTAAEERAFGEASESVREAVTEKAKALKEMADAAVNEAKAQGLTPKAVGEALRVVGDKAAEVGGKQSDQRAGGSAPLPPMGSRNFKNN